MMMTTFPNFSPAPITSQQNNDGVNDNSVEEMANMTMNHTLSASNSINGPGFRREMLSNEDERPNGNEHLLWPSKEPERRSTNSDWLGVADDDDNVHFLFCLLIWEGTTDRNKSLPRHCRGLHTGMVPDMHMVCVCSRGAGVFSSAARIRLFALYLHRIIMATVLLGATRCSC